MEAAQHGDGITIRQASPADYDLIATAVNDWWQRDILPALPRLFLDHFFRTSQVAEDDQGLAGFFVAFISPSQPGIGYVHFVGVRPGCRRHGLARRFYDDFATFAAANGCREIHALTAPTNERSVAFHRSIGFEVRAAVRNHNGPGHDMTLFRRPLGE